MHFEEHIFKFKLKSVKDIFKKMVMSSSRKSSIDYNGIKESRIEHHHHHSSRPTTKRIAELPSLRYGTIGAKSKTSGPLRINASEAFAPTKKIYSGRFCDLPDGFPTKSRRRVRFTLPSADGTPCESGANAAGVASGRPPAGDGWLRTRAPLSKRSDARRDDSGPNATPSSSSHNSPPALRRRAFVDLSCAASVPVTASPGPRSRTHPTGRYIKGTLSPTSNAAPHATPAPGGQALLRAARDGDELLLRDLLRKAILVGISEIELNSVDSSGRTALSYIASNGTLEHLEQILQLPNLNPNKPDNEGNTPLHFAAQAGQVECLNCILTRCTEIEIDARNNLGFTALMKAALQGRNKCAKLLLFAGANPTLRDNGRGFRADQWARFCGRYVCADVIEKYARQRLLERSTSYGNWGKDNEMGARVLMGKVVPVPPARPAPSNGLKSKLKKVFRSSSSVGRHSSDASYSSARLVTQLTSAALCASSPVLPSGPNVPPVVKSLIRPLTVPKLQITLVNNNEDYPNHNLSPAKIPSPAIVAVEVVKPARAKKKA